MEWLMVIPVLVLTGLPLLSWMWKKDWAEAYMDFGITMFRERCLARLDLNEIPGLLIPDDGYTYNLEFHAVSSTKGYLREEQKLFFVHGFGRAHYTPVVHGVLRVHPEEGVLELKGKLEGMPMLFWMVLTILPLALLVMALVLQDPSTTVSGLVALVLFPLISSLFMVGLCRLQRKRYLGALQEKGLFLIPADAP